MASAGDDFYQWTNGAWLDDPKVTIPEEYPRWGSFIKLVDEAFVAQISIMEGLARDPSSGASADSPKLAAVWEASMARFESWSTGGGDYSAVTKELSKLEAALSAEAEAFPESLGAYLAHCMRVGIGRPLSFDKGQNLESSDDVVLDLGPSGLSLPSRDYYLEDDFKEQRGWYVEHLNKVAGLVGGDQLQSDFATRVLRFETKLAMITMKKDQSRQYHEYFTVTQLDTVVSALPELKFLEAKLENYATHGAVGIVADGATEADEAVLQAAVAPLSDAETAQVSALLERLLADLDVRAAMAKNYEQHYGSGSPSKAGATGLVVYDGDYFRRIFKVLLAEANRDDLLAYMQYKVVRSASSYCTKALDEEFFDFFSRKLGGQKAQKSAEKRSVALVNAFADELMGIEYVAKHFSAADKATVKSMVGVVVGQMGASLEAATWLTPPTRAKGQEKLAKFVPMIGFPDKWKDYSSLDIAPGSDSLFSMSQKVAAFEFETEFLRKLNTVTDKTEWEMPPQMVNAYFHPLRNCIVFPSAILQAPFYQTSLAGSEVQLEQAGPPELVEKHADLVLLALNYGGIGAVIAHEITHGFDDQGRRFDAAGNVSDWWTEDDAALFTSKTKLMDEQVDVYKFTDEEGKTHSMNASLTMGENLADLGGLSLAFQALQKEIEGAGLDAAAKKMIDRAFFLSWGTIWKSKAVDAFLVKQLATDPHAPTRFRGNLVSNIDAWYDAFDVAPDTPMYLPKNKRLCMW